jgi:hypothetical protein
MRGLTPSELLDVWERGATQRPNERALTMLAAAAQDAARGRLEEVSVGRRDEMLLMLRERTFGSTFTASTECPGCGERLECAFDADAVRATPPTDPPAASGPTTEVQIKDYVIRFREANTSDLVAVATEDGIEAARAALLDRCVVSAWDGAQSRAPAELPREVVDALVARMGEADPQADVTVALACPSCGRLWEEVFDIAAFLWSEISAWAPRLLREVQTLAAAYGWREADILAMGPKRRRAYLELIGQWTTS